MASPRRARSLFLSPDKAELLAAKEINNLVNRVEVIPRKPVPRQGRRTDIIVETTSADENRMSTTSTISTVDAFCREYRPPSVALHRLSYLNKELPAPPPSETPKQTPSPDTAVSRTSTQKHAAVQTTISIQSRYSTRIKPSTRSRLSIISSQQRDSDDHISIRSHFSAQESAIGYAVSRSEPRDSVAVDRRQTSTVENTSKEDVTRQTSGSIFPDTVPHQADTSTADGHESQDPERQEVEIDPQAPQEIKHPFLNADSKEIELRNKSKSKISVGWTFSDGLVLKSEDKPKGTPGSDENLALEPISKAMIPIRWTFHDGIIYKAIEFRQKEDDMSAPKSKRMLPIGWSFHDGLILRPDGSVKATPRVTGESEEIVHDEGKSRRLLPISWSFHDGLIIRSDGSVTNIPKASYESEEIMYDGRKSKRMIPISWSFHDGLTLRSDGSVKATPRATGESEEIAHDGGKSKRMILISWSFHDGLFFAATHESVKSALKLPNTINGGQTEASSKRLLPISWTFHEGLIFAPLESARSALDSPDKSNRCETGASSKRLPIAWSFHKGLIFAPHESAKSALDSPDKSSRCETGASSKRLPIAWTFYDGLFLRTGVVGPRPSASS